MTNGTNLAIVIPAYKIDFFEDVLRSLSLQTCRNFNVYVGIDASPYDFESVIERFSDKLNLKTQRFKENLGGRDLVGQWNRCLAMTGGEEWVWLFSDDDIMEPNCVEFFYKQIEKKESIDIYHFNVDIIDNKGTVINNSKAFPEVISGIDYLRLKNASKLNSFVVEFIFKRSVFEKLGGFQKFDMAWGSDVATWAKIGREKGIKTIPGVKVLWRSSGINITTTISKEIIIRKLSANVDYYRWCKENFSEITYCDIFYYMSSMLMYYSPYISSKDFYPVVLPLYSDYFGGRVMLNIIRLFYPVVRLVHKLKHAFENNY